MTKPTASVSKPKAAKAAKVESASSPTTEVGSAHVPLSSIVVNWDDNYRGGGKPTTKSVRELSDNMKVHGVIEPLVVTPDGDKFLLIAGYRRMAAALAAGLKKVPIHVMTGDLESISFSENSAHVAVNPLIEALRISKVVSRFAKGGKKQADVAEALGRSESYVSRAMMLIEAPGFIQALVRDNGWSISAVWVLKEEEEIKGGFKVVWDSPDLVGQIFKKIGKTGQPSANEVASARNRIMQAAADAENTEDEEEGGEEAGSKLDQEQEARKAVLPTKDECDQLMENAAKLYLLAGEEAKDYEFDRECITGVDGDVTQRKAYLYGLIAGLLYSKTGTCENPLDAKVMEKRRAFSVTKRVQEYLVFMTCKYDESKGSKAFHDALTDEDADAIFELHREMAPNTKLTFTEIRDKLVDFMDKAKARGERAGGNAKEEKKAKGTEVLPTPAAKGKAKAKK